MRMLAERLSRCSQFGSHTLGWQTGQSPGCGSENATPDNRQLVGHSNRPNELETHCRKKPQIELDCLDWHRARHSTN